MVTTFLLNDIILTSNYLSRSTLSQVKNDKLLNTYN